MALMGMSEYLKNLSLGLIICGLGISPVIATQLGGAPSISVNNVLPKLSPASPSPTKTVISNPEANKEKLSIQANKLFDSVPIGQTKEYSYGSVSLNFGSYKLRSQDLLVSPAQDGIYYLARAHGNGFKLEDETIVHTFNKAYFKNKGWKNIKLEWRTPAGTYISRVTMGSCKFKVTSRANNGKKLTITCSQFSGRNQRNGETGSVTINENEFKNFVS